jgi:16S rRNA (guanine527-N7)-methyltransferase
MSDLLDVHAALLQRFRKSMNLVGPGPVDDHFVDSHRALQALDPTPAGHWVDLGSGAGFPGIPLVAMHPDLRVDLVDSRRKRCTFLQMVLEEAEVSPERCRVLCQRVEELDGPYDGVVSRAFAPPADALAHAARLLRPGGRCVLFLQGGAAVPEVEGFTLAQQTPYEVGGRHRRSATLVWSNT